VNNLFHPEVFQGNLQKKQYFEGWYIKSVTRDLKQVIACIPGISLTEEDPHAFIQVIYSKVYAPLYIRYLVEEFHYDKKRFFIQIGKSTFSDTHIHVDIMSEIGLIKGDLEFSNNIYLPSTISCPSIMGYFAYIPKMECNHGVVSVRHDIKGSISYGDDEIIFDNGTGYIEKDWGTSFPTSWVWLHTNTGDTKDFSFLFSYATIPFGRLSFNGFLIFLYVKGTFYRFATYNRSKVKSIDITSNHVVATVTHKDLILTVKAETLEGGLLQAPVRGVMQREIIESLTATIEITLQDREGNILHEIKGVPGGFEVSGF
jgi:hypothetical protein